MDISRVFFSSMLLYFFSCFPKICRPRFSIASEIESNGAPKRISAIDYMTTTERKKEPVCGDERAASIF